MAPRKKIKPAEIIQTSQKEATTSNGEASQDEVESPAVPTKKPSRSKKVDDSKTEQTEPIQKKGRGRRAEQPPPTLPDNVEASEASQAVSEVVTGVKRGRGRPSKAQQEETRAPKRRKLLPFRHQRGWGQVLTVGQGDTGQLGLGDDVMEKSRPAAVKEISDAVDAVAGGMHTAVLDKEGQVWTFGCNDEGSLGRLVEEEEDCFQPGRVSLEEKIVMVSAGDSHTAALSESGQVVGGVSDLTISTHSLPVRSTSGAHSGTAAVP